MKNLISVSFLKSFIYFISHRNTLEISRLTEERDIPAPPPMQHLAGPAGVLDGLMSICLSVPAVQVGGYSAQQVEIGRHTATPPASCCCAIISAAPQSRTCRQVTGINAAPVWLPYCGWVLAFQLISNFLSFNLVIVSPPLSTGILGICRFANLEQPQSRPNVLSQTPKIYAFRRHAGLQGLARHLIRYCGNIGNYRLWGFSLYISVLHSVNYLPHVCVCADAHTHSRTLLPLWCGWQLLWNSSHSWRENHKFLIQTSTSSVLAERNPSIKNQHPTPMSALRPLTLPF